MSVPVDTIMLFAVPDSVMLDIVRWGGKVMGVAECTFPHPSEWRLGTMTVPLDGVTVRNLTHELRQINSVDPSCLAAWELRIGKLPHDIGQRYNNKLLTPKDWMSHFKNVLHRAFYSKNRRAGDQLCRCCKSAIENLQHIATCSIAGMVFDDFALLADVSTGPSAAGGTLYFLTTLCSIALSLLFSH